MHLKQMVINFEDEIAKIRWLSLLKQMYFLLLILYLKKIFMK